MKQSILFSLVLLLISGCGKSNVEIKVTETPAIPTSLATNTPFSYRNTIAVTQLDAIGHP